MKCEAKNCDNIAKFNHPDIDYKLCESCSNRLGFSFNESKRSSPTYL